MKIADSNLKHIKHAMATEASRLKHSLFSLI